MEKVKSIIESVSESDRNSFNEFYELFYDQIFRYSYFFLKDKEACKEVVSNVFFSIWQSRSKLKDIHNINTWMYVIAKNESNRYLIKNKNRNTFSLDEVSVHLHEADHTSTDDVLLEKEIDELLTRVINELPERCRMIFLMARQEGLKPKDIAERLSINESTVRVQMKIAIEKIITSVKPHFPDLTLSVLIMLIYVYKP